MSNSLEQKPITSLLNHLTQSTLNCRIFLLQECKVNIMFLYPVFLQNQLNNID
jgi:hypothetical protein